MDTITTILQPVLALSLAPLLAGIINRVKALFAGRKGQPLLQLYFELWKLLHKGAVYSRSTSWIFRAAPILTLAVAATATLLVPIGGGTAPIHFEGDLILFAYIFALMRFFTVIAALDTASSFEGMGASREVTFSALAEPGLLLSLAAVAHLTGGFSLSRMFSAISGAFWYEHSGALLFAAAALAIITLAENARIPVDDPNTHLELTMIHEVMILDNSGPDLAFILYASAIKLWLFSALIINLLWPAPGPGVALIGILTVGVAIGVVESTMARLRLIHVPRLLMSALALSVLALVFGMR